MLGRTTAKDSVVCKTLNDPWCQFMLAIDDLAIFAALLAAKTFFESIAFAVNLHDVAAMDKSIQHCRC